MRAEDLAAAAAARHAPRLAACLPVLLLAAALAAAGSAIAQGPVRGHAPVQAKNERPKPALDHSGRKRVGIASYYARRFSGRKMADGTPMRPESDNAASRTLPLGTTAKVTNPGNGKTALVTIRDRGPYAKGRIIDLSPRTARQLGITEAGVAKVEVLPLSVPQPDGGVKTTATLMASSDGAAPAEAGGRRFSRFWAW